MKRLWSCIFKFVVRCAIWYHLYNLKNVNCTNSTKLRNASHLWILSSAFSEDYSLILVVFLKAFIAVLLQKSCYSENKTMSSFFYKILFAELTLPRNIVEILLGMIFTILSPNRRNKFPEIFSKLINFQFSKFTVLSLLDRLNSTKFTEF